MHDLVASYKSSCLVYSTKQKKQGARSQDDLWLLNKSKDLDMDPESCASNTNRRDTSSSMSTSFLSKMMKMSQRTTSTNFCWMFVDSIFPNSNVLRKRVCALSFHWSDTLRCSCGNYLHYNRPFVITELIDRKSPERNPI